MRKLLGLIMLTLLVFMSKNLWAQFNPEDGLVFYLPFNGNAMDVISGYEGVLGGRSDTQPTLTENRFGEADNAYFFNGSINQWITFDDRELILPLGDEVRTLSVWIKSDGPITDGHVVNYGARTENNNCHISVNNGIPRFGFWSTLDTDGKTKIDDDEWHHLVGVMDGIDLYLYVDAVIDTVRALDILPATTLDPTNIMTIGIIGNYEWAPYHGTIDEVRIYDLAFYEEEVRALYEYEETIVKGDSRVTLPDQFILNLNYPNPFNPETTISYTLKKQSQVRLEVLNIQGQTIEILVNQLQGPGQFEVNFDGAHLTSGVYLYRLQTDSGIQTNKMILLK